MTSPVRVSRSSESFQQSHAILRETKSCQDSNDQKIKEDQDDNRINEINDNQTNRPGSLNRTNRNSLRFGPYIPSLPSLNDMFTFLPEGHEKAIKQAFYNTATILFVFGVICGLIACYFVLEPFL